MHFHFDLDDPINTFSEAFEGDDSKTTQEDIDKLKKAANGEENALKFLSNSLTLVVTNETPSDFTLASTSSSSMASWSPPQTLTNSGQTSFILDFGTEIFSSGKAQAVYNLGKVEAALTIEAKDLGIEIVFSPELNDAGFFSFPPPLKEREPYRIGLIDGATMSVVIVDASARGVKQ